MSKTPRIKSNSESLKEKFPKIYQDLFSRCFLVTSAPGTFWWTGEYGILRGGLAITQKLPLRIYVGFESNEEGKIKLGDYETYISSHKEFRSTAIEEPSASHLTRFLEYWLNKHHYKKGITIQIVSEVPYRSGLNASGALAAALALGLHILVDSITPKEVERWKTTFSDELIKNKRYKFINVFHSAWQLNALFHGDIHSGTSPFAPFLDTPYPVIYFGEKTQKDLGEKRREDRFLIGKNIFEQEEGIIKNASFFGVRMEELFSILKNQPPWPIDFGLIYTGATRISANVIQSILESRGQLKETANFVYKEFKKYLADHGSSFIPRFYDLVTHKSAGESLFQQYVNPLVIISLEVFKAFKEIFQTGFSETYLKSFFDALNKNYDILAILGASNPTIDYICSFLKKEAKKFGTEFGIALKTTGSGKGGDILFAVASRDLYYKIDELIEQLNKGLEKDVNLDYASWIDGIAFEGIKIEQSLSHRINSDFIAKGSVYIRALTSFGHIERDLYTINEFENEKQKMDLLINPFEKAIYVRGYKLDSKELHSTRATIGLLKILLDNIGKEVSNRDLPASSYRADRNEFQSKIISPLKKAVLNHAKKKIDFSLRGGIVDFRIKFHPGDADIFYVEKIFS